MFLSPLDNFEITAQSFNIATMKILIENTNTNTNTKY